MVEFGYSLSSEEHRPLELVEYARHAEQAGFSFAMISDHYHPWIDAQGQSPFVWSVIGGIAATTERIRIGTGVTCPLIRIHPAIIAQAAATAASMLPGRFWLGLGSGEALNEHILGDAWPPASQRIEMLEEAIDLMQELWTGETITFDGNYYHASTARIYTLPEQPIPVLVAASGERSASLAAQCDGMIATTPDSSLVDVLRAQSDGRELPRVGQITVCWAPTDDEARETSLRVWPTSAIPGPVHSELPLPEHYEVLAKSMPPEKVWEAIPSTSSAGPIVDAARQFVEAGYDHVYFHQIGKRQKEFLDFAAREVIPQLRQVASAA
jgi:G6PDH family F420-dependent oxidoreductase